MRLSEDLPLDPEVIAELDAIDATLRGEAVDPKYAELAELALLIATDRPQPPPEAAESLDALVARRFEPSAAPAGEGRGAGSTTSRRPRLTRWALRPSLGTALAGLAAAAVAVVVVTQVNGNLTGGGTTSSRTPAVVNGGRASAGSANSSPTSGVVPAAEASTTGGSPASGGTGTAAATTPSGAPAPGPKAAGNLFGANSTGSGGGTRAAAGRAKAHAPGLTTHSSASSASSTQDNSVAAPLAAVPVPPANGQKQIQSAQIQLLTAGNRIDAVSQEVFTVVGNENGVVKSSTITAAGRNGGFASFRLSIPSGNLAQTMTDLSKLPYAHVASRTDETVNVNDTYQSDLRRLADARALRTSLLKQLAAAVTQTEIDSLDAQIKDNEAAISRDEVALKSLDDKINYSQLLVQINTALIHPVRHKHHAAGGFTMHRAAHDALRVLTVATGVALIALAAMVPVGLVVALVAWIGYWIRRRRREAALDTA